MIHIKIVTPRGIYLERDVFSVHMKTVEGEMTLLPNHTPLFAALVPCPLTLTEKEPVEYALSGGFLKFMQDDLLILTDAIEGKDEIDIDRAKSAYQRAKARLEKRDTDTNMKRASLALARALTRINVYGDR